MTDHHNNPTSFAAAIGYDAIAELGIAFIEIVYDGCDDSGCIDHITARDADRKAVVLADTVITVVLSEQVWDAVANVHVQRHVPKSLSVREAVEQWAYDVLEEHFSGWEIDNGSCGTIAIDVTKRTATLNHEERVVETCSSTVEV